MTEQEELDLAVAHVLGSASRKKLIVAGPGAGKTFLFKRILEGAPGDEKSRLVLTFINELKDDLERSLSDRAGVYTLHGYCHYLLRRNPLLSAGLSENFEYFPSLPTLIKGDWEIVRTHEAPQFVGLMRDLQLGAETEFYLERSDYYDAIGYDDSVFRVYLALSNDADQVSEYDLILIDEFQDFNRLESSFIDLLASASPIVIAGDDDQALYSQLRSSNPDFIRALHSGGEFEVFELPFCMRCPAAIVAAVNAVIAHAQGQGCLKTRINKPFRHFTPVKGGDSKKYPYIQSVQCSVQSLKANYFGKYIARAIKVIPREEINESHDKLFPTVLIIGSIQYLRQVEQHLTAAGFAVHKREEAAVDLKREDGLGLLKEDPESNLGWRIVLETDRPVCASAAIRTSVESGRNLHELIPADFKERILKEAEDLELATVEEAEPELPSENKDVPIIKLVSFEGSKGLSAQHVFVVGVHEGELPHDAKQIKDLEVCKFLVALTRTRKQCHVMTTSRFSGVPRRPSLFVRWLPNLVTRVLRVNKENVTSL